MSWRNTFHPGGFASLGVPTNGGNNNPGTGPDGINAGQLQPNARSRNMDAGVPYQLVPAYPPFVRIANDPNIVYFVRFRTLVFGGNAVVAATTTNPIYFSVPTIIIARTAAAYDASGAALPVGLNSLDLFKIQFARAGSSSDLIDAGAGGNTAPNVTTLGSALLGTGQLPALIPGQGLFVDTGSFINVTCQILRNNVEVNVSVWTIEEYGPARG